MSRFYLITDALKNVKSEKNGVCVSHILKNYERALCDFDVWAYENGTEVLFYDGNKSLAEVLVKYFEDEFELYIDNRYAMNLASHIYTKLCC